MAQGWVKGCWMLRIKIGAEAYLESVPNHKLHFGFPRHVLIPEHIRLLGFLLCHGLACLGLICLDLLLLLLCFQLLQQWHAVWQSGAACDVCTA